MPKNPYSHISMVETTALGLDDILLVPQYSKVVSRLDPDLSTKLTTDIDINIPLCSSAMDTVTEEELAIELSKLGGVGFLHRFADDEKIVSMVKDIKYAKQLVVPSIGIRSDIVNWVGVLLGAGADAISIDIAHGYSAGVLNTISVIRSVFPGAQIIAGNVCTAEATACLINAGVNAVKCGVGGGHACSTRIVTGCGVSTFTALCECASVARKFDIPIIMDGGIKNSGDIVKCLAAGASSCMMGYLFSRTLEAPGPVQKIDGIVYKAYRGMASEAAQVAVKGGMKEGTAAEGVSMLVPVEGTVGKVVEELCGGIRSGMSYCGAFNLIELQERAVFTRISSGSHIENRPFGLENSNNLS